MCRIRFINFDLNSLIPILIFNALILISNDLSWAGEEGSAATSLPDSGQEEQSGCWWPSAAEPPSGSILGYCLTAWRADCSAENRRVLHRLICTGQNITAALCWAWRTSPSLATSAVLETSSMTPHPDNHLFDPLPSGRRYRSHKPRTNRLRISSFPGGFTGVNNDRAELAEAVYSLHQQKYQPHRPLCN